MYPEKDEGVNYQTDEAVYFFTAAFYPLDTYSAHQIFLWSRQFPTAEHAYQWRKFSKSAPAVAEQILNAPSPHAAGIISAANKSKASPSWHEEKIAAMREIFTAKAQQHEDVREALQKTGNRLLVENSPVDTFWGAGPTGQGLNHIGKIWMNIRDNL